LSPPVAPRSVCSSHSSPPAVRHSCSSPVLFISGGGFNRRDDPHWIVCGIPEVLYSDHGSDFTSRHLDQVGADLKVQLIFSLPASREATGASNAFSQQ
jgi:transposase InsO family protein